MEEDWEDIDPEELYDLDVIVGHGYVLLYIFYLW